METWLRAKFPADVFLGLIDEFLLACERREQLVVTAGNTFTARNPGEHLRIEAYRAALITGIKSEIARHHKGSRPR